MKRQLHHFDLLDEQVLANLASIYSEHISPIGPRIQVAGNLSLEGAALFLCAPEARAEAGALPAATTIVPLVSDAAETSDAGESFISRMVFAYVP